jgi:tRNA-specific 2-thiouridylase
MNPCVDCRIFMLRKAKRYAKSTGAAFIFTGEVLGQRPMSQHRGALDIIEREAGLKGKILRPLSAKLLPRTEAEEKGFVGEKDLMDIRGRSRKRQIEMAKQFNIAKYPCAAGGCFLTDKKFANKLRDLLQHKKRVTVKEVNFLKVGRHFRFGENKIVVGRNEAEMEFCSEPSRKQTITLKSQTAAAQLRFFKDLKRKELLKKPLV